MDQSLSILAVPFRFYIRILKSICKTRKLTLLDVMILSLLIMCQTQEGSPEFLGHDQGLRSCIALDILFQVTILRNCLSVHFHQSLYRKQSDLTILKRVHLLFCCGSGGSHRIRYLRPLDSADSLLILVDFFGGLDQTRFDLILTLVLTNFYLPFFNQCLEVFDDVPVETSIIHVKVEGSGLGIEVE